MGCWVAGGVSYKGGYSLCGGREASFEESNRSWDEWWFGHFFGAGGRRVEGTLLADV